MSARGGWVCVWMAVFMIWGAATVGAEPVAVAFSAGEHNVLDGGEGGEGGLEIQFAPRRFRLLPRFVPALAPFFGGMVNSDNLVYGYAGVRFDMPLGPRWVVSPGIAAGVFGRGDGQNLGGPLEFRSSVELAFRFGAGSRLGILFYHLSNGGIYRNNPGGESLAFSWTVGLGSVLSSRAVEDHHGR
jgi:lipid A 3-O-deacylase